jgi:DNA-3-methyladenine glycosylase I
MNKKLIRCWNTQNPLYIAYHDKEWGVPLHDDNKFFEFLALGSFQIGLSWWLILQRRDYFRTAFDNFDVRKIARYNERDIERILNSQGIIKNRPKISAVINNAQKFLAIQKEFGSFNIFIWNFVGGKTVCNSFSKIGDVPTKSAQSKAMDKELKNKGFKLVGPTVCYAFMQATGLVNDHIKTCFRYEQLKNLT